MRIRGLESRAQEEDMHYSSRSDDSDWGVDELYYFSQPQQTFRLTSAKARLTTRYHDTRSRLQTLTIIKAEVSGHTISASTMIITSALYQNSG
jgi:hypothetical protein